jgi:hypothetical protein
MIFNVFSDMIINNKILNKARIWAYNFAPYIDDAINFSIFIFAMFIMYREININLFMHQNVSLPFKIMLYTSEAIAIIIVGLLVFYEKIFIRFNLFKGLLRQLLLLNNDLLLIKSHDVRGNYTGRVILLEQHNLKKYLTNFNEKNIGYRNSWTSKLLNSDSRLYIDIGFNMYVRAPLQSIIRLVEE